VANAMIPYATPPFSETAALKPQSASGVAKRRVRRLSKNENSPARRMEKTSQPESCFVQAE
jgi:hypothetical protein